MSNFKHVNSGGSKRTWHTLYIFLHCWCLLFFPPLVLRHGLTLYSPSCSRTYEWSCFRLQVLGFKTTKPFFFLISLENEEETNITLYVLNWGSGESRRNVGLTSLWKIIITCLVRNMCRFEERGERIRSPRGQTIRMQQQWQAGLWNAYTKEGSVAQTFFCDRQLMSAC